MLCLNQKEKQDFCKSHCGKEMLFVSYYKNKFSYEFFDENSVRFILECGDTDFDIYRDHWRRVEKIGDEHWAKHYLHDVFIDDVKSEVKRDKKSESI